MQTQRFMFSVEIFLHCDESAWMFLLSLKCRIDVTEDVWLKWTCELVHEDRKCCILNLWSQNHGWERRKFRSFPPPVLCTYPQFIFGDTKKTRSERVQSLIIGRVPAETSSGIVSGYQVQSVSCLLSLLCVWLVGFVLVLVLGCWPWPV